MIKKNLVTGIMEKRRPSLSIKPVRRDAAEFYLTLAIISFAASVSVTRLFLSLTGYPQLGGGELHIAHVLWGGLLLFIAALLPLIIANLWVYNITAILAGIGVGLFIDEVGKFITQSNNYFFPAAAPIIYIFFLLTLLVYLNVRRFPESIGHAEFHRALGQFRELFISPLKPKDRSHLEFRLHLIADNPASERHAELARALLKFIKDEDPSHLPIQSESQPWVSRLVQAVLAPVISGERLRIILIIGIGVIGLLMLKNPLLVFLSPWLTPEVINSIDLFFGRRIPVETAPLWFWVRVALECVVGLLLLISAGLLTSKHKQQGAALGYLALLLSLMSVDVLLFYFEQFSTIITTAIQFLLLLGTVYYQRHIPKN